MLKTESKSAFFRALGNPIRLRIVNHLLKKGECTCICELSRLLKRDQSVIFRHIQILKNAGIINVKKDSRFLMCCIADEKRIKKFMEV